MNHSVTYYPAPLAGQATGTSQHTVMRDSGAAARASGVASANGGLTPGYDVGPDCKVIILPQHELDKANKDRRHFPSHFQVHLGSLYCCPFATCTLPSVYVASVYVPTLGRFMTQKGLLALRIKCHKC